MSNESLVTIAIASYNNAPYIERCVESVINQTYQNLEILIVDDGSKDDSLNRIEKYKSDKRVRIVSKENGGLSSVRQMCLEKATGEYISFIDADDYLAPTYVEKMLNKLLTDKSDICLCSTRFEDMEGNYLEKESKELISRESTTPVHIRLEDISDPNEQLSAHYYLSDLWDKMYRTSFIRESGVVFDMPKGLNGSDMVFNRRLFLHCPVYSSISSEEYIHVIYKSSAVHRKNKDLLHTTMFVTEHLLGDVKSMGVEEKMRKRVIVFYYWGVFLACQDVYHENPSPAKVFREMKKRHLEFIRNNRIVFPRKDVNSKVLLIFSFFLDYLRPCLSLFFWSFGKVFK